jgi:CheY-like chemotaxis protein
MIVAGRNRILIVEDDQYLREAFRTMLEDGGYQVSEAGSGAQALAVLEQEKPDIILLDLGLPDTSGLDVARAIKKDPRTAHVVLVALTGSVGNREKEACLAAGCAAYYAKPISPKDLLRQLPSLLR